MPEHDTPRFLEWLGLTPDGPIWQEVRPQDGVPPAATLPTPAADPVCPAGAARGARNGHDPQRALEQWSPWEDTPMLNDRPIDDPRLKAALAEVLAVYRHYDLAGAVMLVNEQEAAFAYPLYTTWNIVVEDATVAPLGFRFRVKESEQGLERAAALSLGTGHLLCQLRDFGMQTSLWMNDLLRMLRHAGLTFTHRPFNGRRLPRLTSQRPADG